MTGSGSGAYTPTRHSTSWVSIVYGGKIGQQKDNHPQRLQGILFGGYSHNFGTKKALLDADGDGRADMFYFPRSNNMNRMWRLSPTLLWTVGKFQLGCEYEVTSVLYGRNYDLAGSPATNMPDGLFRQDLHWVTNHRVQLMTKYNF